MKKSSGFQCWSATPTPMLPNGRLDLDSLPRLVDQHLSLGIEGLFLAGSCGESRWLIPGDRLALVRHCARAAQDRLTLSVQVGWEPSPVDMGTAWRRLRGVGADWGLLAVPPERVEDDNRIALRDDFLRALDAMGERAGLYVLPRGERSRDDQAMWEELAEHPAVGMIKDSSRSPALREGFCALRRLHKPDLHLFTGDEFQVGTYADAGYAGAMLGTGILVGRLIRDSVAARRKGKLEKAEQLQARSTRLVYDLFRDDLSAWLTGLKFALVERGIFSHDHGYQGAPLTDADRTRIREALAREAAFLGQAGLPRV